MCHYEFKYGRPLKLQVPEPPTTMIVEQPSDSSGSGFILRGDMTINGKLHRKGSRISWLAIYPFFMVHMLMFGGSGFLFAYSDSNTPLLFLYAHGGFAILVYLVFYLTIFGLDEVKWMFINAGLGLLGMITQIDWILSFFGKTVGDFPLQVHVIPFLYFTLYSFLLRQALLDLTGSRGNTERKKSVEMAYVGASVGLYLLTYAFGF